MKANEFTEIALIYSMCEYIVNEVKTGLPDDLTSIVSEEGFKIVIADLREIGALSDENIICPIRLYDHVVIEYGKWKAN